MIVVSQNQSNIQKQEKEVEESFPENSSSLKFKKQI
jgi:hypothetical protein